MRVSTRVRNASRDTSVFFEGIYRAQEDDGLLPSLLNPSVVMVLMEAAPLRKTLLLGSIIPLNGNDV